MAYYRFAQRNPLDDLFHMQHQINRLFQSTLPTRQSAFPAVNLYDDGETFHLRAEVAGLDIDKLDLSVAGDVLTVKGQRSEDERQGSYHRRERIGSTFSRSVTLPDSVDGERVNASYKDGILEVHLPRAPEVRPRKIAIETLAN